MEEQVLQTIIVHQQEAIRSRRVAFELEPKMKKNSHGLKRSEEFFIVVMRRNYGSQCDRTDASQFDRNETHGLYLSFAGSPIGI